jgi:choline dehydrogenase-like flavoprotein
MIVDARTLAPHTRVEADVCIVGGGTAGVTLARELIRSSLRVCVLESGGFNSDPETQALYAGDNIGYPYYPLDSARARCLGGSSTLWHVPLGDGRVGPRLRPLDPIDFEQRDWVPYSGWPISKSQLDPYYERAQAVCRIQPVSFEVRDWSLQTAGAQPPPVGEDVETILYKFCSRDLFARDYPREVAAAENTTTFLYANVLEIVPNDRLDRIDALEVATLNGNRFSVAARTFVLAAGGIETPRLLLLSNRKQATGLGNRHDIVGRFFMEHLHFWSGILVPSEPDLFQRTALFNDIHAVDGVDVVAKLALSERTLRRERLLNQNIQLMPRLRPDPFKYRVLNPEPVASIRVMVRNKDLQLAHFRRIAGRWQDLAVACFRRIRGPLPTKPVFVLANMTEQMPNPESRVMLGRERDAFGQNRVMLDWKITRADIASVVRTQEIIGGSLQRHGWGRFYRELLDHEPPPDTHGGYHHIGTTRMHSDPRQGVVDPDCRVHGIGNLYIAGSSVFPTGGYANPVLTTVALTIRLADHVKDLARQKAA